MFKVISFLVLVAPSNICVLGGHGYYYAYTTNVITRPSPFPELATGSFYLQQVNRTATALQGTLTVHAESIGPLSLRYEMHPWTDTGFKTTSEGSTVIPGCRPVLPITKMLAAYRPEKHFDQNHCIIYKGNLTMLPVFFDEIMNEQTKTITYGRQIFVLIFEDDLQRELFGFSLDLTFENRMSYFYGYGLIKEYKAEMEDIKRVKREESAIRLEINHH